MDTDGAFRSSISCSVLSSRSCMCRAAGSYRPRRGVPTAGSGISRIGTSFIAKSCPTSRPSGCGSRQKSGRFKKFEDLRQLGAFTVRTGEVGNPTPCVASNGAARQPSAYRLGRGVVDPFVDYVVPSCEARTPRFTVCPHRPRAAPRRRGGRWHRARRHDRTHRSIGCCRSRVARTAH